MQDIRKEIKKGFFLRPIKKSDIHVVVRLCDECVGKNLYTEEDIIKAIEAEEHFFYLLETIDGKVVGYIYYYFTDWENVEKEIKEKVAFAVTLNNQQGKIQSVGVREEYRQSGLAVEMIQFALKNLKEELVELTYIICWKKGDEVPLKRSLQECEFTYLTEIKKFWYDKIMLVCSYCQGRCECSAEVYYKKL